jgi:hypothetical protein
MADWAGLGKLFIGIGTVVVVIGLLLLLADRVPAVGSLFSWFGRLPGDLSFKRDSFSIYLPLGTSVLISVLLSLVFYIVSWIIHR